MSVGIGHAGHDARGQRGGQLKAAPAADGRGRLHVRGAGRQVGVVSVGIGHAGHDARGQRGAYSQAGPIAITAAVTGRRHICVVGRQGGGSSAVGCSHRCHHARDPADERTGNGSMLRVIIKRQPKLTAVNVNTRGVDILNCCFVDESE